MNLNMKPEMTSSKPYIIRGLYEWITDNGMTPHLMVKVDVENIKVPLKYAQDGKIVLNVSHTAAINLQVNNDYITFSARFSGALMNIVIPVYAVMAIYSKETGAGMVFNEEDEGNGGSNPPPDNPPFSPPGKPHLKLVKN
jgi:stringent starvation protein B